MRRVLAAVLLGVVLALGAAAPASADGSVLDDPCSGTITNDPVICDDDSAGVPGAFVAIFVLALVVGVGATAYKVTTARSMARRSGLDPADATRMTLLTDDGLEATYLAANLRPAPTPAATPSPAGAQRPVAERLAELQSLLDQGLVTADEYDARRAAILDSL